MDDRFARRFRWGVVATIVMSLPMALGVLTGLAPMPNPIPLAIVSKILGEGTPQLLLMMTALASHLA